MKIAKNIKVLLSLVFIACVVGSSDAFPQEDTDLPDELGLALGIYKINSSVEEIGEFRDFDFIHFDHLPDENMEKPRKDRNRNVKVIGWFGTKDGTFYKFATGYLRETKNEEFKEMKFKSVEVNGISYSFIGNFLEKSVWEQGGYTEVIGTLTKYKNGVKIASKEFPFYQYVDEH